MRKVCGFGFTFACQKSRPIETTTLHPAFRIPRIRASRLWIHLLFWSLYLGSEYLANMIHIRPGETWHFFRATLLSLPVLILSSYFLAGYVIPRYLTRGNWIGFSLWLLVVGTVVFFARLEWQHLINWLDGQYYGRIPASKMLKNIIRDYSIVALAVCVNIISDYREKQLLNKKLADSKAEAEIKLLKGQLHPHFLFNSLNNIYSLALMKSELTADSILKLTELLDYLIYRVNRERVPISEELELLENYIGLERLRYDEKLVVRSDIQLPDGHLAVAPLILLPFAENCFKHGGPGTDGIFTVEILLRIEGRQLRFKIRNSKKANGRTADTHGGLGLQNIRQRLELLYPTRHRLEISDRPDSFAIDLQIVLHEI